MFENFPFKKLFLGTIEDTHKCLIDKSILKECKTSTRCGQMAKACIYKERNIKKIIYRCTSSTCRRRESVINTKIQVKQLLFIFYFLLINLSYSQISCFIGNISSATIASVCKKLRQIFKTINGRNRILLGGFNSIVDVDDTVISRRGIIRNPSSIDEETPDTIWILGAIDISNRYFYLKQIINRSANTISNELAEVIHIGTILYSDRHR
ncbi:hypothetical protein DMUE_1212 [Dictyocoela muelleri]|nr:hypothetical protein DMUE_1212 [Dictyocoela muelleri]